MSRVLAPFRWFWTEFIALTWRGHEYKSRVIGARLWLGFVLVQVVLVVLDGTAWSLLAAFVSAVYVGFCIGHLLGHSWGFREGMQAGLDIAHEGAERRLRRWGVGPPV